MLAGPSSGRYGIGIRGGTSDRSSKVTLMEDGVLYGPAPYSAPAAYFTPLMTRMVGVEIFKGPASIRFGPQTVGGAINLRTRDVPRQLEADLDMSLGNLLNETIEIEQLSLSGIHLNLVREAKEANFIKIIANTRRFEDEAARQSGTDLRSGKRFLIHSVVIRDVHVNVDLLPIGAERRNWIQTLVSDGYVTVRHPDLQATFDISDAVGTDLQLYAS